MSKEAQKSASCWSDEIREKVAELAALVGREKYGPDGPPLEMTFSEIESLGHELGRFTAAAFDQHSQEKHARHFSEDQPCPQCGRHCNVKYEDRTLQTRDGDLTVAEPSCYCRSCERSFFPSAGGS